MTATITALNMMGADKMISRSPLIPMGLGGAGFVASTASIEMSIMNMEIYRIVDAPIIYIVTLNDALRFAGFGFGILSAIWCGMLIHTKFAGKRNEA